MWIGRGAELAACEDATVRAGVGLRGDPCGVGSDARGLTPIEAEHVADALPGRRPIDPRLVRRSPVISGRDLPALEGRRFSIAATLLEKA